MIQNIDVNILEKFTKNALENIYRNAIGYFFDDELVGYLIYDLIYDRIEIVDVFVVNDYRCRKIATYMLNYLIDFAICNFCVNITLEVRKDNVFAIKLYEKCGFKIRAIREGYYGGVDGLLMELIL